MSKTITISDDTFEALQEQIKKLETKTPYPLACITRGGDRLILNLPNIYLSAAYLGKIISLCRDGRCARDWPKGEGHLGHIYQDGKDMQIFPK